MYRVPYRPQWRSVYLDLLSSGVKREVIRSIPRGDPTELFIGITLELGSIQDVFFGNSTADLELKCDDVFSYESVQFWLI